MIFQNNAWIIKENDKNEIDFYSKEFNTEAVITSLLLDRGFKSKEAVEKFLNPDIGDLHDPFLLLGMDRCVKRIKEAIDSDEKIWIYGDYDVDGITSISLFVKFFESIKKKVDFYIPDRNDEGYGVGKQGIDLIKDKGGSLIITVDCGITAVDEISYAKEKGIDVIVTDHHEAQEKIPKAIAVVNPKVSPGYPFSMLAGCGVAFKVIMALDQYLNLNRDQEFYREFIEILAFGTIADIVPLFDENRIFTKLGLKYLNNPVSVGLKALKDSAEISSSKDINAGTIGFTLAPRINATGRIGKPSLGVELFLEKNYKKAREIADNLSDINQERRDIEAEIFIEVEKYIEDNVNLKTDRFIIAVGKNWHSGVIGIVASKIAEKHYRPTLILNDLGDKMTGSARSVSGVNVFEILGSTKHLFSKFGGHEQASGLSFDANNFNEIKKNILEYSKENITDILLIKKQKVSWELDSKEITYDLMNLLGKMFPFGIGNPKPQFLIKNLKVEDKYVIGKLKNHFKMTVSDEVRVYDCLRFNMPELNEKINRNSAIDIVVNLEKNEFRGVESIQFFLNDYKMEKMPIKDEIEEDFHVSLRNYVIESFKTMDKSSLKNNDVRTLKVSRELKEVDFEHMKLIGVRDEDVLRYINDYFYSNSIYDYSIINNEIDEKKYRKDNRIQIVLNPTDESDDLIYLCDKFKFSKNDISSILEGYKELIPNRKDLIYVYKNLSELNGKKYCEINKITNMKYAKILLCLDVLDSMDLIKYKSDNRLVIELGDKPKGKIELENIKLFKFYKEILEL